jgi:hypothetical protein
MHPSFFVPELIDQIEACDCFNISITPVSTVTVIPTR